MARQAGSLPHLKPSRGAHVVEVPQVIADADVIEYAAEAPQGDAHAIRPAEAAELAAAFDVRLQVEKNARHAPLFQLLLDRGDQLLEVAKDQLVAAVPHVGR